MRPAGDRAPGIALARREMRDLLFRSVAFRFRNERISELELEFPVKKSHGLGVRDSNRSQGCNQ